VQLKASGLRDARLEAAFVLSPVLKQTVPSLLLHRDHPLKPVQKKRADLFLKKRSRRIPLAYIEGYQPFLDFQLKVSPHVLIPRPETEELVELAVKRMGNANGPIQLADIGTGSGCIAIALARRIAHSRVWGIDLSPEALRIARSNAKKLLKRPGSSLTKRQICHFVRLDPGCYCYWLKGDLCVPLAKKQLRVDALLANLPYVSVAEMKRLQPELRFEPRQALEAGRDGLDLIRRLLQQAPGVMKDNAWIGLEVGHRQAKTVATLMRDSGQWTQIQIHNDFAGIERLVEGRLIRGMSWTF